MVSISDYGIGVIDVTTFRMVSKYSFEGIFVIPPKAYNIYKLIPLSNSGVRVLLEDEGSFSIHWDSVDIFAADGGILLDGLTINDRFEGVQNEISSQLVKRNILGLVQVIYYQIGTDLYNAYVRVFNMFNHHKSKNFRDFRIDNVKN